MANFRKILFTPNFIQIFLLILYIYVARGQGQPILVDKILLVTESLYYFNHLCKMSVSEIQTKTFKS